MTLTFHAVTKANSARARRWHDGFPRSDGWTGADWSNALAGEVGELCNVVKKLRRAETGLQGKLDPPEWELLRKLDDEIADAFIYLDLLATFYGRNLPDAIRRKFNDVSVREGFPERIEQ